MMRISFALCAWFLLVVSPALAVDTVVTICASGCTQTAGTWVVPSDWSSTNHIECVGAGAGGSGATTFGGGTTPGGAGAGAYAKISNISAATLGGTGASITVGVGAGGIGGTGGGATVVSGGGGNGGDSYFNASSLANAVTQGNTKACGGQGGQGATTITGGAGGSSSGAVSTGTTLNAGGAGGNSANFDPTGAGGGGAGGPQGAGGAGGAGAGGGFGGSGGGGSGGGGSGTTGSAGTAATGTGGAAGGNNAAGAGAGAAVAADTNANPGTVGGGGSGGGLNITGTRAGGPGGPGNDLGASKGVGGGGGAGGTSTVAGVAGAGGAGGNYGGAGGGGSISTAGGAGTAGAGGAGAPGIIVITYTPSAPSGPAHNSLLMGISYDGDICGFKGGGSGCSGHDRGWDDDLLFAAAHGTYIAAASVPVATAATFYTFSPASNTQAVGTISASNSPTSFAITAGNSAGDFAISSGGAITVTSQGATDLPGTTLAVSYTLTVTATNAAGTSAGVSISITVYADGFAGAPEATIQHATLLNTYGPGGTNSRIKGNGYQPPFNVPGVDYAVGYASAPVTDWQSLSGTGITVNTGTGTVTYGATSACSVNAVDFSLHNGAVLIFSGCANPTVTNSKFGCSGAPCTTNISIGLIDTLSNCSGTLTVTNAVIDGGGAAPGSGEATLVSAGSAVSGVVLKYNWFKNYGQQVIEINQLVTTLTYTFNVMENGAQVAGSHLNWLQQQGGATAANVNFNLGYQQVQVSAGEGFQWYNGTSGKGAFTNPSNSYNTVVTSGANAMSSVFHGNCHVASDCASTQSTITGTGTSNNNYLDLSGAIDAYYPSTGSNMWANWTLSNNTNMVTGAAISNTP